MDLNSQTIWDQLHDLFFFIGPGFFIGMLVIWFVLSSIVLVIYIYAMRNHSVKTAPLTSSDRTQSIPRQ